MDQTKYVLPKIHIKKEDDSDEKELDSNELFDGEVTSEAAEDNSGIEVIDIHEDSDHDEGKEKGNAKMVDGSRLNQPHLPNGVSVSGDVACEGIVIQDVKSLNGSGDNEFLEESKDEDDEIQLVEEVIGPPQERTKNKPLICKITKDSTTFRCFRVQPDNTDGEGMQVDNDKNNNMEEEFCNGEKETTASVSVNDMSTNNCNENNNWISTDIDNLLLTEACNVTNSTTKIKDKSVKKGAIKKSGKAAFHGPKSKIVGYVNTDEIHVPRRRGPKKASVKALPFPPLKIVHSEVFDLPFQYGWRREIVYRSAAIEDPKYAHKKMDVYYYAPAGKKLRSLKNIQAYLEKTNDTSVSIDCFTFRRIRLSPDISAEVIRCAYKSPGRHTPKQVTPVQFQATFAEPVAKKIKLAKPKKKENIGLSENFNVNGIATAMEIDDNGYCEALGKSDEEGIPKCSSHCPGQQGVIPTLHCNGCLCLFHPQCVGIRDSDANLIDFVCKECFGKVVSHEGKDMNNSNSYSLDECPIDEHSPLLHTAGVQTDGPSLEESISSSAPSVPADQDTLLKMYSASSKCSISPLASAQNYSCGVTIQKVGQPPILHTSASRSSPLQLDAASISVIPVSQKSVAAYVTIPSVSNSDLTSKSVLQPSVRFLVPAVSANPGTTVPQLASSAAIFNSTQPTLTYAVSNNTLIPFQLNLPPSTNTPTSLQSIIPIANSVVRSVPTTPVLTSVPSLKPQLPVIRHDYSRLASPNSTSLLKGVILNDASPRLQGMHPTLAASEHAYNKPKVKLRLSTVATKPNAAFGECSMSVLHAGFNGLLRIFHFLALPDLMRASQVCRTWRTIISHPVLWQAVNLKNCRVTSWESFAKHMQRYGVKRLDLRGMCLFEDKNRTWHEFVSVLAELQGLTHMELGEVPAPIVHTVCNVLTQLKGFSAEWIVDGTKDNLNPTSNCRLSVNKLSQMTALETLRVRGVYGLHLPSPDTGLNCLENLANLKCLSLTSLKDLHSPNFDFLKSWKHLVALELGDCTEWNEETYETISQLTNLQKLRLEFGGSSSQKGLVKALSNLQNLVQLDLILFQIPNEMGEVLAALSKLKSLSIWPDLSDSPAKNNYNTLEGLKQATYLKNFTWGLVTSCLFSNKPGEKFDHQSSCIPFLVRNPGAVGLAELKINAGLLMNKLRVALPSSKVQVMMVPNSSYCTIGYMPR